LRRRVSGERESFAQRLKPDGPCGFYRSDEGCALFRVHCALVDRHAEKCHPWSRGGAFPKWDRRRDFGVGGEANCMDVPAEEDQTACCGVNLAFAGFGLGWFSSAGWNAVAGQRGCGFPKWDRRRDFGVGGEAIRMDVPAGEDQAACCGVNLALAGFGVWCFCWVGRESVPRRGC
jgi:hypothetical protein